MSTWKIMRTQLAKEIVILEILKKLANDMLDSEMVVNEVENGLQIRRRGKN